MRFAAIFLSLGVVTWASVSRAADGPALPSDQDRLQGWWVGCVVLPGAEPPPNLSDGPPFRIAGNRVESDEKSTKNEDGLQELSFTIDQTQDPKTIDIHLPAGNKKITWKGIYVLEKDEVRVAFLVKIDGKPWEGEAKDLRPSPAGRPKAIAFLCLSSDVRRPLRRSSLPRA